MDEDPYQVRNIADDTNFEHIKNELRHQLMQTMLQTKDLGVIPEAIVKSDMISSQWDWNEMIDAAFYDKNAIPNREAFQHSNPVVRYWVAQQLRTSFIDDSQIDASDRLGVLDVLQVDEEVSVRIVALEALAIAGDDTQKTNAISQLKLIADLTHSGLLNAVAALNALATLEVEFENIQSLPSKDARFEPVYFDYIERLKDYLSHKEH